MMIYLRIILSAAVVLFSVYTLTTGNYELSPYSLPLLGAVLVLGGIDEWRKQNKPVAIFVFLSSAFVAYVSVEILIF
jgi:hypothetical protein